MYRIFLHLNKTGNGFFALRVGSATVGRIDVNISGDELMLVDTDATDNRMLKSITQRLMHKIVEYARMNELRIVSMSNYILSQVNNNASFNANVWKRA